MVAELNLQAGTVSLLKDNIKKVYYGKFNK